jgi:hypothetical protein
MPKGHRSSPPPGLPSVQGVFGGPKASSCEDANIAFGSRQAPVHLTYALVFYFEALLYVLLNCALSLQELDDNLVALGATFRITLVKPIS